jgi:hypothetical protein
VPLGFPSNFQITKDELASSPSIQDGLTQKDEVLVNQYLPRKVTSLMQLLQRRIGIQFIQEAAIKLAW